MTSWQLGSQGCKVLAAISIAQTLEFLRFKLQANGRRLLLWSQRWPLTRDAFPKLQRFLFHNRVFENVSAEVAVSQLTWSRMPWRYWNPDSGKHPTIRFCQIKAMWGLLPRWSYSGAPRSHPGDLPGQLETASHKNLSMFCQVIRTNNFLQSIAFLING